MFVWNHQALVHWAMPCPPGPRRHIAAACTAGHPRRGPKPEALGTIRGLSKQNGNLSWFHLHKMRGWVCCGRGILRICGKFMAADVHFLYRHCTVVSERAIAYWRIPFQNNAIFPARNTILLQMAIPCIALYYRHITLFQRDCCIYERVPFCTTTYCKSHHTQPDSFTRTAVCLEGYFSKRCYILLKGILCVTVYIYIYIVNNIIQWIMLFENHIIFSKRIIVFQVIWLSYRHTTLFERDCCIYERAPFCTTTYCKPHHTQPYSFTRTAVCLEGYFSKRCYILLKGILCVTVYIYIVNSIIQWIMLIENYIVFSKWIMFMEVIWHNTGV